MKPNPFTGTEDPAVLADIEAIEQEYSFVLPEDYKVHILQHNGGSPERSIFVEVRPDGEQTPRDISDFYSVRYGVSTLEDSLDAFYDQLHHDLVAFGSDASGDQFVLSVGPQDYGSVYYISHEFYKPPKRKDKKLPRQYGNGVSFLAPSFTAFLNGLVGEP